MKDSEDVQRLIRLKRYETPGEEYFEQFAEEFKDRQRAELLQRSSRTILVERVSLWWEEMNGAKWLVPAGATAAAIGAGFFFVSAGTNENASLSASSLAGLSGSDATLPEFPESAEKVIQLQLPKPDSQIPGAQSRPNGLRELGNEESPFLRARASGIREL